VIIALYGLTLQVERLYIVIIALYGLTLQVERLEVKLSACEGELREASYHISPYIVIIY